MGAPHVWLKSAIEEAAAGVTAWPVEKTEKGDPPYVIYTRDSTTRELVLADTFDDTPGSGLVDPRATFSLVTYADSYVQAWEIASAISAAIHRFSGSAGGEIIHHCLVTDERDGAAGYLDGREQPTYTVETTIDIRYQE